MAPDLTDLKYSDKKYDGWRQAENTVTFSGSVSGKTTDIFTVTGDVRAKVVAVCSSMLSGASATIAVGTSSLTSGIIAQTTATDIDTNEIWHDTSPDANIENVSVMTENIIANGLNIGYTVGNDDITGGTLRFLALWKPLSADGNVVSS